MRRLAWLTDIHLNFLSTQQIEVYLKSLAQQNFDTYVVSGDIGEAPSFENYLLRMAKVLRKPIYFVLGNHDFYFSRIDLTRDRARRLSRRSHYLRWLPDADIVTLSHDTAIIGHDGWADGRYGDYWQSNIFLNDYNYIGELAGISKRDRLRKLHALGDESATYFRRMLPGAMARHRRVFVVTHVPPYKEACWHNGRLSDDHWLPHFASKAVGDVLHDVVRWYPAVQATVLCGHTHGEGEVNVLHNMRVLTGGAEYGRPGIAGVFEY